MVVQTQTPAATAATSSAPETLNPVPTRIQDVPELVITQEMKDARGAIVDTVAELGAKLTTVHISAAEALLSQGLYEESLVYLKAAALLAPENIDNLNQLGYVQYLAGSDAEALETFEKVITLDSQNADALFNVGMISFGIGDLLTAESSFAACTHVDGNNAELWNNLGVVFFQQGKTIDARGCFQKALEIDPSYEDARVNLNDAS